ncbi:MAG: hypothetical protein L3J93_04230 [Thermoplasmata archaeon]|nr:hypothetical protein [Thermoplasmata archaeon]
MLSLYVPALIVAFVITVTEMTEVVAIVFALGADRGTVRHGAMGAVAGTAVVALVALAFGAVIQAVPENFFLASASIVLFAFGIFLFRSTLKSYRRARTAAAPGAAPAAAPGGRHLQFAGGFSVGAVEAIEAVIVLLALSAAGYGPSALIGAVAGGAMLVALALVIHERIRRIKVPTLKLAATSMLFTFAVFWGGEALRPHPWPFSDLFLIPLFVISLLVIRGLLELVLPRRVPLQANG